MDDDAPKSEPRVLRFVGAARPQIARPVLPVPEDGATLKFGDAVRQKDMSVTVVRSFQDPRSLLALEKLVQDAIDKHNGSPSQRKNYDSEDVAMNSVLDRAIARFARKTFPLHPLKEGDNPAEIWGCTPESLRLGITYHIGQMSRDEILCPPGGAQPSIG